MIQVTFSVVNRNEMTLTPHGANLYFNKILIPTEIGSKLLRVGSDEYLRLAEAKGMRNEFNMEASTIPSILGG